MIDHLSLPVGNLDRSRAFYDAALAPLGYHRVVDVLDQPDYVAAAYGTGETEPPFSIGTAREPMPPPVPLIGQHIAFKADNRAAVDAFYRAALATGGTDNGPPGLRPHYHPNYYAAFVIDPDGHHIEAVCHTPE